MPRVTERQFRILRLVPQAWGEEPFIANQRGVEALKKKGLIEREFIRTGGLLGKDDMESPFAVGHMNWRLTDAGWHYYTEHMHEYL